MKRMFSNKRFSFTVELIIRTLIGAIFCASSIHKIFLPYDFLGIVYQYEILGPTSGYYLALLLPWMELTIGLLLFSENMLYGSWCSAIILFCFFVFGKLFILMQGLTIPCGCFGPGNNIITPKDVIITVILLLISIIGFRFSYLKESIYSV